MPYEQMNEQQVADYLHVDVREVRKLASRGQIPCRKVAGKFVFRKGEVDHWVQARLPELDRRRLAGIEKGVSRHHGFDPTELLVCPLIPLDGAVVPLQARTRDAVMRAMVDIARKADLVFAPDDLLNEIRHREELCSTALAPGVAFLHPRHALPHDVAASFVVVGLTSAGVPFGAPDGSLTRLFLLICCKDERTHLHVLARLGQVLHDRRAIDELLEAETSESLAASLLSWEKKVIEQE